MAKKSTEHPKESSPSACPVTGEAMLATVAIPVSPIAPDVYIPDHVEARLSPRQAAMLKRLVTHFDESGARLCSTPGRSQGQRVVNGPTAVKHLLDLLADSLELSEVGSSDKA